MTFPCVHTGELSFSPHHTRVKAIRPTDVLARLGGEEFAVLLAGAGLSEAAETAEQLRGLVANMRAKHHKAISQSPSVSAARRR